MFNHCKLSILIIVTASTLFLFYLADPFFFHPFRTYKLSLDFSVFAITKLSDDRHSLVVHSCDRLCSP